MDWTSIYHESGNEELLLYEIMAEMSHHQNSRTSRLLSVLQYDTTTATTSPSIAQAQPPNLNYSIDEDYSSHRLFQYPSFHQDSTEQLSPSSSSYTLFALYCLAINYILGVGCLGVPYAFAKAGILFCFLIFTIVTVLSYITVMWVAETGQRFQQSQKIKRKQQLEQQQQNNNNNYNSSNESSNLISKYHPEEINFEVLDLMGHYVGYYPQILYQISFMALMYIGLLAYSQVFCGSIAAIFPSISTPIPQIIFGTIVIPLSCMELEEQVSIQAIMALVRFLAIFTMIFGSIMNVSTTTPTTTTIAVPLWKETGFAVAFSTALFSQVFQHSVPGLIRPLHENKVGKVPHIFAASLLTTFVLYVVLGTVTTYSFGPNAIQSSINLNFVNFTFGLSKGNALTVMASQLVVMFPALDTLSVFPLIANTLGNNLFSSSPAFIQWIHRIQNNKSGEDKIQQWKRASKIANITWKLIASIPPLIGSIWSTNLSFSFLLAGLSGVYVAFIAPSLLQYYSSQQQELLHHRGWYSYTQWILPVISFATFAMCMLFYRIVTYLLSS